MLNNEMEKLGMEYIMYTYKRYPICIVEGKGSYVKDIEGKEYLDFVGGIAVMALGHGYEKVVEAIKAQNEKLMQCSNLFWIEPQIKLAKLLVENSFADKAFFCNSGAEANEAAIKLARKHASLKYGEGVKSKIITMKNSFHGRTIATITATGQEKYQKGFAPLPAGFEYVPFNDIDAIEASVDEQTCAVMLEPVQGEGGILEVDESYLKKVRELCDKYDAVLIYDEVQCGLGRTGKLFAYEHYGIAPDIMTLSKALGGGMPIGCCLATNKVASSFNPGDHASTFGGNPISAAGGFAAVSSLIEDGVIDNAKTAGEYLYNGFVKLKKKYSSIKEIRGKGLLLGIELDSEAAKYISACQEKGLLICSAGANVLRFLPPLTVTKDEMDAALGILGEVLGVG